MATLKTSAFNLTETLINTVNMYRKNGVVLAEESKQLSRIGICASCKHLEEGAKCNLCGCYMNVKIRLEAAKCPALKW